MPRSGNIKKEEINLVAKVSSDLEIVRSEYEAGKAAFERGAYRSAVEHLEKSSALVARNSRLGGEVQLWLVTAYEATGQTTEAIALCEQLKRHPSIETSKQARQLLYILQAPQLQRPTEWLTQIPELGTLAENENQNPVASLTNKTTPTQPKRSPEPVDLSQVNTKDNRFIWIALIIIGLTVAILWSNF